MILPDTMAQALFGPTRRQLLALLFGRPDERFYLREIVRAIGTGSSTVQRELAQLVEAGLVHREAEGRQVYFSVNRDAPVFPELYSLIQKTAGVADVLRRALGKLIRAGAIEVAFVYGSVAAGTPTASSDVDLMIVGRATLSELLPALRTAEAMLGREINPTTYPREEFRAKVRQGAHFVKRVLAGPKLMVTGDADELARLAR